MSYPLFTTAIQLGKGDSILQKRDLLTLVFTQNPNSLNMKNDDFIPHDAGERDAFSLFRSLTTNKPSGLVTLSEVYRLVTTDASLKDNTE